MVDADRARSTVESWRAYLDEHRDEITALQLGYEAGERRIDFAFIQGLAARISRPPHNWTPEVIWGAYAVVDAAKVHPCAKHTLTDLVSLIRYSVGVDAELVPYAERVRERYAGWLAQQEQAGVTFTDVERWWLDRMVSVIANSAGIRVEDLDEAPFIERGGTDGAIRDLGDRAGVLLEQLNAELTARLGVRVGHPVRLGSLSTCSIHIEFQLARRSAPHDQEQFRTTEPLVRSDELTPQSSMSPLCYSARTASNSLTRRSPSPISSMDRHGSTTMRTCCEHEPAFSGNF